MPRVVLRLVAAVALITGSVLVATSSPAGAADAEYGWWSVANTPGGLPVSAPVAPTDGIYASLGPFLPGVNGPIPDVAGGEVPPAVAPAAVGAIRFPAEVTDSAVLMLEVTASSTPPQELSGQITSAILACPISDPSWTPVQNGSFDQRPIFDCGGVAAVGAISTDGKQVTWELSPIFQTPSGLFDVAIVALGQTPYFISFAPPGATSISIIPGEDTSSGGDEALPDTSGGYEPGTTAASGDLAGAIDAGALDTALPPVDSGIADVPATSDASVTPSGASPQLPLAASPRLAGAVPKARDNWRLVFGALLVLIGFGLFWTAGQNARLPRLIGPLHRGDVGIVPEDTDLSAVRGIGRYAQPRVGSPRRLR